MFRARAVGALALPFGYVIGHVAGCIVTHGHSHDHNMGSLAAQHAALPALSQVALPLLLLSLTVAALMGARGHRWGLSGRSLAATLAGAFTVVETFEHLGNGMSPTAALADRVLWAGIVVQIVLAFGLAGLLRRAHDLGSRLHHGVAASPELGELLPWHPHDARPSAAPVLGVVCVRGPPAA